MDRLMNDIGKRYRIGTTVHSINYTKLDFRYNFYSQSGNFFDFSSMDWTRHGFFALSDSNDPFLFIIVLSFAHTWLEVIVFADYNNYSLYFNEILG